MLICGYPGIGKTTVCKQYKNFIDFESSTFSRTNDSWFVDYCNTAKRLSDDGYIVFISTHKEVRDFLNDNNIEYNIIYPSIELKDEWIAKLKKRFFNDTSNENYLAIDRVMKYYEDDIQDLIEEDKTLIQLEVIDYDLRTLLNTLLRSRNENGVK